MTGIEAPSMTEFDGIIQAHMAEFKIPGGAVAVMRGGRLVYARGYGCADRETREAVQPDSLFRIASVSKPVTAVAVMTLVQDPAYHLSLDAPVFPLLGLRPFLAKGHAVDSRIWKITVRHLLEHAGGWDRDISGDIMFKHFEIARDMKVPSPPSHNDIIRWAMGQPLDFDPGARYAYSNLGYLILGRVIEKVSGMPYERYVREHVLAPAGVTDMRIGKGRRSERLPGEVCYYDSRDRLGQSVFSADGDTSTPMAYAFQSPETMDAHGGWVASAPDLMRFAAALDRRGPEALLTPKSLAAMYGRPAAPLGRDADGSPSAAYYALGWQVRPVGETGRANTWHNGSMPGTASILVRMADGTSWALLFNSDDADDLDALMHRAVASVKTWPDRDLFYRAPSRRR
jgi:N-acyl-D-amino-acid deacylase